MSAKTYIVETLQLEGSSRSARMLHMVHGMALSLGLTAVVLGTVTSVTAAAGTLLGR